jgi:2-C-methyl-D-erythritol 2,4-cyclodiphosphate synthase
MRFKVGIGYDVHQLEEGKKFVLGGVPLAHEKGPVAHSDGDVLIHALCDALLGAANLRDIGTHFPDTSDDYEGVDSKLLLKKNSCPVE